MQKASLKRKIVVLILTAIGCAQAVVVGVTLWQEASRYAKTKKDMLLADAHVLASAVSKPVAAREPATIYAALRAIGEIPGLTYVGVLDSSDQTIAELGAAEVLSSDLVVNEGAVSLPVAPLLATRSIVLRVPIVNGGLRVGRLVLISDARDLKSRLYATLRISAIALLGSMLIAILIAWRMQRSITRPLGDLTGAMQSVGTEHNYALSLKSSSVREVGILIDGFNTMLGQIRDRDIRIAESHANLERQVADRTVDLRLARDAAESANAQKSDFLATMSHEIRTPMNGMLVMAELLAQAQLPGRLHRYAEVVWRSGQGLLAIINDILDFSKIEAGKLELESVSVNLAEVAATVIDLFAEKARSKNLDLAARVAVDVPLTVSADPVRLNQVLSNLVNNALKFTESGGVLLDVALDPADPARIRFSVIDTGIGIAADKIGSVFGAFSQADQSTTRRYGGTGLGLAICRKLVLVMGSEIDLTSTLGEGSTFAFSVALPAEEPAKPWPVAPSTSAPVSIDLSGAITARSVRYYFQEAGYPVESISVDGLSTDFGGINVAIQDAARCTPTLFAEAQKAGCRVVALLDRGSEAPDNFAADTVLSWPVSRRDVEDLLAALVEGRSLSTETATAPSGLRPQFINIRALVADDNEINREVASEALSRLGIAADCVEDGAAAVEAAAMRKHDVIFMDGSMPVLDGFEATRRIRQAEQAAGMPPMPIIALTAHVVGTSSTEWAAAGMNAMLAKPFTLDALAKCLREVLDLTRIAEDAPHASRSNHEAPDPLVDEATLTELRRMAENGRPDFMTRVIGLYLDHAPRADTDIVDHAEAQQYESLAKAAHALKSMSLNIGATRVARLASEIERHGKSSSQPDQALLHALTEAIRQTCTHLGNATPRIVKVA